MDRRLLIVGGVVALLAATVAFEYYVNWQHPVNEVKALRLNALPAGARSFTYVKDGAAVGSFEYTVSAPDTAGATVVETTSSVTAGGKLVEVRSRLRVSASAVLGYSANASAPGSATTLVTRFKGGAATIRKTIQGEAFDSAIPIQGAFAVVDNNVPAHWELALRGFSYEPGRRYSLQALVPQLNQLQKLELYVDEKTKAVTAGGAVYECTVVREVNSEVALYMSGGRLIQYRNEPLNIEITLR